MSEWQLIETAPKDGTWICLTDGKTVAPAYWGPTYFSYDPDWIVYSHRSDSEGVHLKGAPTHWMPLPQPPEQEQSDE